MREFLDNNEIDITDYVKQIFDEDGEYIKPNDVIRLFDKNFDKYIMTKIEKGKVLEEFNELIRDWNKDKVEVIRKGLYNKYIQNEILKIALLNTGDKYLVDLVKNNGQFITFVQSGERLDFTTTIENKVNQKDILYLTIFDKERFSKENLPILPEAKYESSNAIFVKDKDFFNKFEPSLNKNIEVEKNVV